MLTCHYKPAGKGLPQGRVNERFSDQVLRIAKAKTLAVACHHSSETIDCRDAGKDAKYANDADSDCSNSDTAVFPQTEEEFGYDTGNFIDYPIAYASN